MDVITMSSKGQFVVPRDIREEMGLLKTDKFIIVHDKDSILLKKINREEAVRKMNRLLLEFGKKFKEAGITEKDVEEAIKRARA